MFGKNLEKQREQDCGHDFKRNAVFRFFGIIGRKFWSLMVLNLMQFVCCLPVLAVSVLFISSMYLQTFSGGTENEFMLRLFIGFIITGMQLIVIGPLHAGIVYVMRNYAREENAFLWSDFVKGIKQNWKRALAVSAINAAFVLLVSYAFMFYSRTAVQLGAMAEACRVILIILGVVFAMMQIYIYPMMVTLDLTVKQLYGNALRFAAAKFLPNIAILAVTAGFYVLIFTNVFAGTALMLLTGYSLTGFLSVFYAYGAIDKYIIRKIRAEEELSAGKEELKA